jgi:pyridoxamine 5'-phosphate oxidase family protein
VAFNDEEIEFIRSQPLARVATVAADGQPDVVPVTFEFDGRCFTIGGYRPQTTRRTRNLEAGNNKVALVIDDLVSVRPWVPRYLRVYGTAELIDRQRRSGTTRIMRITPTVSWSMNLSGEWTPGHGAPPPVRKALHGPG